MLKNWRFHIFHLRKKILREKKIEDNWGRNKKMTKKQKVVFAVVAAVLVLGIILSYIFGARNQHRDGVPQADQIKITDTEPQTQAADVTREVETSEPQTHI
jgi:uncharacterized membrane protein YvbJ